MNKVAYLIIGVDGDVMTRLTLAIERTTQTENAADVIDAEVLLGVL